MAVSYLGNFFLCSSFVILYLPQITSANILSDWLHDAPGQNATLVEEIQCYSLPYGGIGFASHIITYYTIIMLSLERSPLFPSRGLSRKTFDTILGIAGLIGTVIVSCLTIVRCRSRWQFVVIAVWKLDLSLTFSFLSIHTSLTKYYDPIEVLLWLLLYIPGVATGLVGLISLVVQTISTNHNVFIITVVFGSVTLAVAACAFLGMCVYVMRDLGYDSKGETGLKALSAPALGLAAILLMFGVLGAFYSDWILAAVAGNLAGAPSSDNSALFWSYFILKRFPFFSI